jgi:hypothetical protein
VKQIRKRLTYANVMSSIAVFLILGGATAFAAKKIGSHQLKASSVTTTKIKRNAVTATKIKKNAVTTAKIKSLAVTNPKLGEGSVNFAKIAPGTNVIATASGGPVAANNETLADIPLTGTATFVPQAGVVDLLSIEAKGNNLGLTGTEPCTPTVVPFVNGNVFEIAQGVLQVRAFTPTKEEPSGLQPVTGETAPLGLTSPGAGQTVSLKVFGDADCSPSSTVSVALAVTQAK